MLNAELLARIRRLEIKSTKLAQELFSGKYKSVFKGRGIEFSDVRDYQWGDDIRAMHWQAMARFAGKPYLKRFTEERELTVILAVDLSGSLGFGSINRLKREIIVEVSGLIAYLALKNRDNVGLLLFTDKIELYLTPKSSRTHTLRLLRELMGFKPESSGTDIKAAMEFLLQAIKKSSIVFFASDFIGSGFEKELAVLSKKHDLIAISVTDPLELALPALPTRLYTEDAENPGSCMEINLRDQEFLHSLKTQHQQMREKISHLFRRHGVDRLELTTEKDFIDTLIGFFTEREHRKALR